MTLFRVQTETDAAALVKRMSPKQLETMNEYVYPAGRIPAGATTTNTLSQQVDGAVISKETIVPLFMAAKAELAARLVAA